MRAQAAHPGGPSPFSGVRHEMCCVLGSSSGLRTPGTTTAHGRNGETSCGRRSRNRDMPEEGFHPAMWEGIALAGHYDSLAQRLPYETATS
jgi:hypothetical protein